MDSHPETSHWVAARLATLAPDWEPSLARGRSHLAAHDPAPRRAWRYGLATAAAALLIAALAPSGRAMAQDLWYRLFVSRLAVVRLDLSKVPLDTDIRTTGAAQEADSIAEASRLAGYTVELPPSDALPGVPILSVLPPVEVRQRIQARALRAALAKLGADDIDVPAEWEGLTVHATVGRTVVARFLGSDAVGRHPDDVTIVQTPAVRLDVPAGVALDRLAEAIFRAGGLSWWEARQLGEEYAAHPAWLLDAPENSPVTVETVPLAGGTAIVIEDDSDGLTTVWVTRPWRIYGVSSPSREKSLRVASALR
jgi:hypothetical protein